jgi:hypothetical protein
MEDESRDVFDVAKMQLFAAAKAINKRLEEVLNHLDGSSAGRLRAMAGVERIEADLAAAIQAAREAVRKMPPGDGRDNFTSEAASAEDSLHKLTLLRRTVLGR